jgi:DNA-binding FadR family transcriptional regulator
MAGTLSDRIGRQLFADLQSGKYPAGSRLPAERLLMLEYGAGRNTLREAVRGLVALGLLDVQAGRGTTVRVVDGRHALDRSVAGLLLAEPAVRDLLEFRLLLETDAAALAAQRATPRARLAVRESAAAYEDAVRLGRDVYSRDVSFHRAIADASGNAIYVTVIDTTAQVLIGAMRDADRAPGDLSVAAAEHAAIAHLVGIGDADGAREAMRAHILAAEVRRNSSILSISAPES